MTVSLTKSDNKLLSKYIEVYLQHRPPFYAFIRPQEALFFQKHQHLIKKPILDFGCGDGFFANQIFGKSSIDIGLDLDASRIKEAKQCHIYKKLVTYDGNNIPFPDNHFGSIISNCVFEHLPNLDKNLLEMHRVLKPGGLLLTTVMTDKWEDYLIGGRIAGSPYLNYLRRKQEHYNLFSCNKWEAIFQSNGFKVNKALGYISPTLVKYNEITHYLSLPTLISYKLTGNWVPLTHWHKGFNLTEKICKRSSQDLNTSTNQAAALFYLLTKTT